MALFVISYTGSIEPPTGFQKSSLFNYVTTKGYYANATPQSFTSFCTWANDLTDRHTCPERIYIELHGSKQFCECKKTEFKDRRTMNDLMFEFVRILADADLLDQFIEKVPNKKNEDLVESKKKVTPKTNAPKLTSDLTKGASGDYMNLNKYISFVLLFAFLIVISHYLFM